MRLLGVLALALSAFALAACGGDGGGDRLTQQEYTSQANAICNDFDDKIDALKAPTSIGEVDDYADKAIPLFEEGISQLKDLQPPEDLQSKVDEWLGIADEILQDLRDLREAGADEDQARLQRIVRESEEKDNRSDALAREIGANDCADD